MKIVIATKNNDKKREIQNILSGMGIELLTLNEFPNIPDVVEDGKTLEANAIKKAKSAALFTGYPALADDSGLEVDALNFAPGVFSARYAGEGCSYKDNNQKLLHELEGVKKSKRKATFRCVIALSDAKGKKVKTVEGKIRGCISLKILGKNGFGYDPVFFVPKYSKTFAELGPKIKNQISHRARALGKAKKMVREFVK